MNNQSPYLPLLELTRGGIVESIHFGAIAVVTPQNELVAWYADPQARTFLRSSAKPFQAIPFIEHGGKETYNLTLREVALICASHSGTDEHVAVARSIQAKTGVQESDLLCGVHPLSHRPTIEAMALRRETVTPNRHNCSGKHTGMVAYARLLGLPYGEKDSPYIDPAHPIQKSILAAFSGMCGLEPAQVTVGVDGCSAPNFAVPLQNSALAFARLCDPSGLPEKVQPACRTIFAAMTGNPDMVGGPDSFDTRLMQVAGGKLVAKGGAEGYQGIGIQPGAIGPGSPALGITFKVSDGDLGSHTHAPYGYARPAVAIEILRQLGALTPAEVKELEAFGPEFTIENWRKIRVGKGYPCFHLERPS